MAIKMKGIYKGFKYISQIFVVKEREIEIGYPTDVKHVAHIGWDGQTGSAPSWMNEFKAAPDFTTSIGNPRDSGSSMMSNAKSTWSSQDFDNKSGSDSFKDAPNVPTEVPSAAPKKHKRKKKQSGSSPTKASTGTRRAKLKAERERTEQTS